MSSRPLERKDGTTFHFTTTDGPWKCPCGGEVEADTTTCAMLHTMPPCAGFLAAKTPRDVRILLTTPPAKPS